MKKFSEIEYVRPDMEAEQEKVRAYTKALKEAKSYEELRGLFMEEKTREDAWATMAEVAQVRYTVDTRDSFYEGEVQFWNETIPAIHLLIQKAEKVIRSIRRDISDEAYLDVYYATLSAEEDALQAIYNFLRVGFAVGCRVLDYYTNPHVMRILELRRKVGNESHHFREFARFQSLNGKVYVCHLEPKSDVIMLVGRHFADRMPSEHWMIIDDTRKTACVHPKDGTNYLRYLTDAEFETLRKTEEYEDEYTDMWKTFFHAVGIKERENYICQRNLFPIWKRKHAVEFKD